MRPLSAERINMPKNSECNDRARQNGFAQRDAVIISVDEALEKLEADVLAGAFKGRLTLKEVARRAGVHEKTLHSKTHSGTTRKRVQTRLAELEQLRGACPGGAAAPKRRLTVGVTLEARLDRALSDLESSKQELNAWQERYAKLVRLMNVMFHKARQKEYTIQRLKRAVEARTERPGSDGSLRVRPETS